MTLGAHHAQTNPRQLRCTIYDDLAHLWQPPRQRRWRRIRDAA